MSGILTGNFVLSSFPNILIISLFFSIVLLFFAGNFKHIRVMGVLKNFAKVIAKHLDRMAAVLQPATLLKKRPQHKRFLVN